MRMRLMIFRWEQQIKQQTLNMKKMIKYNQKMIISLKLLQQEGQDNLREAIINLAIVISMTMALMRKNNEQD